MTSLAPPTPTIHYQSKEYKVANSICRTHNWSKTPSPRAVKGAEDGLRAERELQGFLRTRLSRSAAMSNAMNSRYPSASMLALGLLVLPG